MTKIVVIDWEQAVEIELPLYQWNTKEMGRIRPCIRSMAVLSRKSLNWRN